MPHDAVAAALRDAWREFPEFFPTLGELAGLVSKTVKRQAEQSTTARLPEVTTQWAETPGAREVFNAVKSIR